MESRHNPDAAQEKLWADEKQQKYKTWRAAQIDAALGWVRQVDEPGEQRVRLRKLVGWFSESFSAEVERRHWGRDDTNTAQP